MQVFPVLPLKTLVTRQVIRDRMEYKDYLGGEAREELDMLEWFQGKFIIKTSTWVVRRKETGTLSEEQWQSLKSTLPCGVISFLDDGKEEFSIFEKNGKSGEREWELQDIDGSTKRVQLGTRITENVCGCGFQRWEFNDQVVKDGLIITWQSFLNAKREMLFAEQDEFEMDEEGIYRIKIWTFPKLKMKIRMDIEASREDEPK